MYLHEPRSTLSDVAGLKRKVRTCETVNKFMQIILNTLHLQTA